MAHFGRQWAGSQAVGAVLVQGHWETHGGKGKVLGLLEAQAGFASVTGWPAVTCGARHMFSQVF